MKLIKHLTARAEDSHATLVFFFSTTDILFGQVPVRILVQPSRNAATGILPPRQQLAELLLQEKRVEVSLPPSLHLDLARGAFVKLNPGFHSYFRAEYR